ncbi:hypothetical protein DXG03_009538 [Asterophora parasitica]|uniref:F-box domain-containing protein n=1 Tax=Asterophora parasitica TaxID=117018 RepID=A0A9P7GAS4_9AGAR|nr:hypothetical protein DXG03_009538 [Asterophora parasitica]
MSNLRLPHELIDIIIDHLHHDRIALAACCLVSKAWLVSSRYHLLTDVLLGHKHSDDVLALPPPSIFAVAARRLMLSDKTCLPPGIEHFSSVTSFYLRVSTPNEDMLTRLPVLFSRLTLLELNQVVFDSFADMVQLVCSFPNLETLTHFMCPWIQEVDQPSADLCLPPRLHTLNILSLRLHVFFDWFNASKVLPPLSTVRLYGVAEPHMTSVGTAIENLGDGLENLTLDLWDHEHGDLLAESIDLSHSPNLRSLTLVNGWPKLLYRILLTHARHSHHLQHLTLTIYEGKGNIPNLELLDWRELDHFVASSRLVDLTVRVYAHNLVSKVDKAIVETRFMPTAARKGKVRFVQEKERFADMRAGLRGPIAVRSWGEEVSR